MTLSEAEALAAEEAAVGHLVEGLLLSGGTSLLLGDPKGGKTETVRGLVSIVSGGARRQWLGRDVSRTGVVHLYSLEGGGPTAQIAPYRQAGLVPGDGFRIGLGRVSVEEMAARAVAESAVLIVVDTLAKATDIEDGNDYRETIRATQPFEAVAAETGAHIISLHHARKAGGHAGKEALGSTALAASADTIISLRLTDPEDFDSPRIVSAFGRFGVDTLPPTLLRLAEDGSTYLGEPPTPEATGHEKMDRIVAAVLAAGVTGSTVKRIVRETGIKRGGVDKAIRTLVADGYLRKVDGAGPNPARFYIPELE